MVVAHQGRKVLTIGGMLLFGQERERLISDAWIQVGRFQGLDKSRIEDHAAPWSHLLQAVEDEVAFVRKHINHGADVHV